MGLEGFFFAGIEGYADGGGVGGAVGPGNGCDDLEALRAVDGAVVSFAVEGVVAGFLRVLDAGVEVAGIAVPLAVELDAGDVALFEDLRGQGDDCVMVGEFGCGAALAHGDGAGVIGRGLAFDGDLDGVVAAGLGAGDDEAVGLAGLPGGIEGDAEVFGAVDAAVFVEDALVFDVVVADGFAVEFDALDVEFGG